MKDGDPLVNCREAKEKIKKGQLDLIADHTAMCPDCMAFAQDFREVAPTLEQLPDPPEPSTDLFQKTLSLVKDEIRLRIPAPEQNLSENLRTTCAVILAVLFAPVLILLNYGIATTGQMLLVKWLPPAVGTVFFVLYAFGTIISISLAYGSLPLLVAAARDALHSRTAGGGLTA